MFDPARAAAEYGLAVEVVDLGDWRPARLISEYDPAARAIRINQRALAEFRATGLAPAACDPRELLDFAIAHELYHHREALGEAPRCTNRRDREAAADAYARANLPVSARLLAFVATRAPS